MDHVQGAESACSTESLLTEQPTPGRLPRVSKEPSDQNRTSAMHSNPCAHGASPHSIMHQTLHIRELCTLHLQPGLLGTGEVRSVKVGV